MTHGILREAGDCTGAGWARPPRPVHTRSPQQRELRETGAGPGRAPRDFQGAPTPATGPREPSYQPTPPPLCRAIQVAPRNASPTKFCTAMSAERERGQPWARQPAWARVGARAVRQEPGRAPVGTADTAFSEPSEAGAPNECPIPAATCPAQAQVQHPRGTEGGGTVAQVTNSIRPVVQRSTPTAQASGTPQTAPGHHWARPWGR